LVWFGLISYPLYIWHWPLLSFNRIVQGGLASVGTRVVLVAIAIGLAWLTYRFVELPIRNRAFDTAKALTLLVLTLIVGSVGYSTLQFDGLPGRSLIKDTERIDAQFEGPLWKYTQNDICLKLYPFKEATSYLWWFCMASKDEKPTLLLLGNSLANALYPGLVSTEAFHDQSILSIGTCGVNSPPIPDPRSPCYGDRVLHQQQLIDNIIATSGSLKYVIIEGFNLDAGAAAGLKSRIDSIENHNAKVILFKPYVALAYDPRECFSRPFNNSKQSCEGDLGLRKSYDEVFGAVVDQLARTNTHFLVFDPNDAFCNGKKCSMIINGMPALRDKVHLSEYGSIEVAKVFQKWAVTHAPDLLR